MTIMNIMTQGERAVETDNFIHSKHLQYHYSSVFEHELNIVYNTSVYGTILVQCRRDAVRGHWPICIVWFVSD